MASDFTLKANDRLPSIQATLSADLTGAAVKFIMKTAVGSTVKVNATAVLVSSGATSVVRYDWLAIDTATPGEYLGEWQVTFAGGKVQTFPTLTYHSITILADLDGA